MIEDQNYEENKEPTVMHLRKMKRRYMNELRMIKENNFALQLFWLLNNTFFCYDEELTTNNLYFTA